MLRKSETSASCLAVQDAAVSAPVVPQANNLGDPVPFPPGMLFVTV